MKLILSVMTSLCWIKWRQLPDMTITVDWNVKQRLKQNINSQKRDAFISVGHFVSAEHCDATSH